MGTLGTPLLGRIAAGALAGVAGTLAMDLVQYRRAQRGGRDQSFPEWEFASSPASFEEASGPAKVAQQVTDVVDVELPDEAVGPATNVVHWLTGIGYGATHGLLQHRHGVLRGGLATGLGAFAGSYAALGATGIYQPIWEYDRETLQQDLTAHLAFGLATAIAYGTLTDRDDRGEVGDAAADV